MTTTKKPSYVVYSWDRASCVHEAIGSSLDGPQKYIANGMCHYTHARAMEVSGLCEGSKVYEADRMPSTNDWGSSGAWFEGHTAKLSYKSLRKAEMKGVKLNEADLSDADLTSADLRDANLSHANLREANLQIADLSEADISLANLSDADLRNSDLTGAILFQADLSEANLNLANLSHTNMVDANLNSANLAGACLCGAYFNGTDLSQADLSGCLYLESAELPPGYGKLTVTNLIRHWVRSLFKRA